ncbi:MAG: Mth938-like domain-containing protein [Betaproteobacteria bacterium]|nr:Mth938-like domain-containing protein [Betaproteobacteria bacterium]
MKLNLNHSPGINLFTSNEERFVTINHIRYDTALIVTPERIIPGWATGFDALTADDFVALVTLGPKIVLLGTGRRQRFPAPALLRPLIEAGVSVEPMDLPAACRTYNILALENRPVAAALLFK